jgi:hypothetical protein
MLWYEYLSEWCCRLIEFRDGAQPVSALRVTPKGWQCADAKFDKIYP